MSAINQYTVVDWPATAARMGEEIQRLRSLLDAYPKTVPPTALLLGQPTPITFIETADRVRTGDWFWHRNEWRQIIDTVREGSRLKIHYSADSDEECWYSRRDGGRIIAVRGVQAAPAPPPIPEPIERVVKAAQNYAAAYNSSEPKGLPTARGELLDAVKDLNSTVVGPNGETGTISANHPEPEPSPPYLTPLPRGFAYPFALDVNSGRTLVCESDGDDVLTVSGRVTTGAQDDALAAWIVDVINWANAQPRGSR